MEEKAKYNAVGGKNTEYAYKTPDDIYHLYKIVRKKYALYYEREYLILGILFCFFLFFVDLSTNTHWKIFKNERRINYDYINGGRIKRQIRKVTR